MRGKLLERIKLFLTPRDTFARQFKRSIYVSSDKAGQPFTRENLKIVRGYTCVHVIYQN